MSVTGLVLAAAVLAMAVQGAFGQTAPAADSFVYISGAVKGKAGTIGLYRLNGETGALVAEGSSVELPDPNFMAVSADQRFLYATINRNGGTLAAFGRDMQSGKLTPLNEASTGGLRAVHVSVDPTGKAAVVANYQGNTVAALGIDGDGRLRAATAEGIQTHTGSGPNVQRQGHPYPHSIYCDGTGKFAYSCDLGTDQIWCYQLDGEKGALTPSDPPTVATPPGSGPRHMAFAPNGKFAYVVTEMGNSVIAYEVDGATGRLKEMQELSTLPAGLEHRDQQTGGEIAVHPSGKFLYVSNRGPHSSIVAYGVDEQSGKLKLVGDVLSGGQHPRQFAIDPTGRWLLVGNMNSDNVTEFRIDAGTGALEKSPGGISVAGPMCIVFTAER